MYIAFFEAKTGAKTHVCETEEVLDLVLNDLKTRGITTDPSIIDSDCPAHLDYGGPIIEGTQPVEAGAITFFAHQYSWVRNALNEAVEAGDRGGYFKIHGERAVCLTPKTFNGLVVFCKERDRELQEQSAAESETLLERIAKIVS